MSIEGYNTEASNNKHGAVFIDDVSITPGPCQQGGNCDFEDGIGCGWSQSGNDDMDWLILQADSPSNAGGPIYDHTHMAFDGNYFSHSKKIMS